jgi:hypothetical protein
MAEVITYTCDICEKAGATNVKFSNGSKNYEVDLCAPHLKAFNKALEPFSVREVKARRTGPKGRSADKVAASTKRAWLRDQGYQVSDNGRIPHELHAVYDSAH